MEIGHAVWVSSIVIRECPPEGPEFQAVLALLKRAKQTVGFLPNSAVRDRAERGTLLIATVDEQVTGYVLYDLPRNEIRIVQLVVAESARRSGSARRLVDEIASRNPARRGIGLECRRDFKAASAVWRRLGFIPRTERRGRSANGRPLTAWWRDFDHPTLFTYIADEDVRPVAALDANLVIDLADRARTLSRYVAADWVSSACRLGVTDEVFVELEGHDVTDARIRHKRYAAGLGELAYSRPAWKEFEGLMTARIGTRATAYAGDIRHSAKAAAAGARWFVTRDDKFRRACSEEVHEMSGLKVVSPTAFVLELDHLVRDDLYRPADLAGSEITIRGLRPDELDNAARAFVNQPDGERLRDFRALLNDLAADTQNARVSVFGTDHELLALSVLRIGSWNEIAVCRVRRGPSQETLARHMLGWLRTSSARASSALLLKDGFSGQAVARAAIEEGFLAAPECRTAIVVRGVGGVQDLQDEIAELLRNLPADSVPPGLVSLVASVPSAPESALSLEAMFHPYSVVDAGLQTFLVPIRHAWAADLLDPSLSREQLFPRSAALALQREHVYYRSPHASGGLRAPARILWYVSGSARGGMAIRAISHLEEVVIGDARRLYRRFSHLGVYTEVKVRETAVDGVVMALRFSRTRALDRPVALTDYRRLVAEERPGGGLALAGPQPMTERVFVKLAKMAG